MNGEKERNVSGKYVEKMFNLKKILVLYLIWFIFVGDVGTQGYVSRKCIHWKIFEQTGIGKAA